MKYLVPFVCTLLLSGCNSSSTQSETASTPTPPTAVEEPQAAPAPVSQVEEPKAPEAAPASQTESKAAEPAKPMAAKPEKVQPKTTQSAPVASIDGGALFGQKCATCHGSKAEKQALGKSQVIAGWEAQRIKDALHGYQAGTYGKEMKAVMQGQAKGLSDAQIDALASHISSL